MDPKVQVRESYNRIAEAAGFELVWDRWIAEGSGGGHLFVLARRHDP